MTRLAARLGCDGYRALHRVSVDEPDRFWRAVRDDLRIPLVRDWDAVRDDSRGVEWTTWFEGARLNVADACVHIWAGRTRDAPAAVFQGENGVRDELTFAELSSQVIRLAEALSGLGVAAGDRVAIYMPMSAGVAVASHACAHIGAVQVPIFSGFAAPAIVQRLRDSEAKVVITADYSFRRGTRIAMRETIEEARPRGSVGRARGRMVASATERGTSSSAPVSSRRSRSRQSIRTSSRTPRAPPDGRRARSTCMVDSFSRSRAKPRTRRI